MEIHVYVCIKKCGKAVYLYVSVFSRETTSKIQRGIERGFIMGIGSAGYGVQEVPQSAVWYKSVRGQRPGNQGAAGLSPRVRRTENQVFWCPRAREDRCPSSRRGKEFALSLPFFFIWAPKGLDDARPFGQGSFLSLHPHRHTQKWCFTSYLGVPSPREGGKVNT